MNLLLVTVAEVALGFLALCGTASLLNDENHALKVIGAIAAFGVAWCVGHHAVDGLMIVWKGH